MGKRASVGATGPASKKPASAQAEKCHAIASAVKEAKSLGLQDFPDTLVDMLSSMTKSSIGVYKDTRHGHQEKVVDMIGNALKAVGAAKEAKVRELKAKIDATGQDKASRQQKKDAAEANLNALKEALTKKREDVEAAKTAKAAAQTALKEAKKTQTTGDAALEAVGAQKAKLEVGLNSLGNCPLDKKGVQAVQRLAHDYKVDSTLTESMHTALTKSPEARGTFDDVIMTQLKEALTGHVAKKDAELKVEQPGKDARAAAVAAAQDALEASEAHLKGCNAAEAEAEKSRDEGTTASKATAKAVDKYLPDLKATMDSYDDARGAAKDFQEGPLAAFGELRVMETPPPEPEPVEEAPAEAEAETAAAAEPTDDAAATV